MKKINGVPAVLELIIEDVHPSPDQEKEVRLVSEVPPEAKFYSDSQDVRFFDVELSQVPGEFDSYFVVIEDGEIERAWGMEGIVPYLDKHVWKVR